MTGNSQVFHNPREMSDTQQEILKVLKGVDAELSIRDLVREVQRVSPIRDAEIRAGILPLISLDRIRLTSNRKLRFGS